MKRDLGQFTTTQFDLLIVGGGIYGACAAWDAAMRGLSVALLEQGDFGNATSANSMKVIHSGFRYLQHADFVRIRESIQERRIWLRIAPHLVRHLPCVMPTYGHGIMGPEAMRMAVLAYESLALDRNLGLSDSAKRIPRGRVLSQRECLSMAPGIRDEGLTGGVLWYDVQMLNSERMTLSCVLAAAYYGASVANYARVTELVREGQRVVGAQAQDLLSGKIFQIKAKVTLNAAGPWLSSIAGMAGERGLEKQRYCKTLNIVVRKKLAEKCSVAVSSATKDRGGLEDKDALIRRSSRFLYAAPWREGTIVGSPHLRYDGDPAKVRATAGEIAVFLEELNKAYPAARLTRDDVTFVHCGLIPMTARASANGHVELAKHPKIVDHAREAGVEGLVSVQGVKYTTSRRVAQQSIDRIMQKLGRRFVRSQTDRTPVWGGAVKDAASLWAEARAQAPRTMNDNTVTHLVEQYGAEYRSVLEWVKLDPAFGETLDVSTRVIGAEVLHALKQEMAVTLADVVFRRTELGSAGHPGERALLQCAQLVGRFFQWDAQRIRNEQQAVEALFQAACGGVAS